MFQDRFEMMDRIYLSGIGIFLGNESGIGFAE